MYLTATVSTTIVSVFIESVSIICEAMLGVIHDVIFIALPVVGSIMVVCHGIRIFKIIVGDVHDSEDFLEDSYDIDEVDPPSWMIEDGFYTVREWEDYGDYLDNLIDDYD